MCGKAVLRPTDEGERPKREIAGQGGSGRHAGRGLASGGITSCCEGWPLPAF